MNSLQELYLMSLKMNDTESFLVCLLVGIVSIILIVGFSTFLFLMVTLVLDKVRK